MAYRYISSTLIYELDLHISEHIYVYVCVYNWKLHRIIIRCGEELRAPVL